MLSKHCKYNKSIDAHKNQYNKVFNGAARRSSVVDTRSWCEESLDRSHIMEIIHILVSQFFVDENSSFFYNFKNFFFINHAM